MFGKREAQVGSSRVGVAEVAALLGRWPHPDELAAAQELDDAGSLTAAVVVAGSLRFGLAGPASDRPEAQGRDFAVDGVAGLLAVLEVHPGLVVALQSSPESGVRMGLAWPAPPPPGFVAVSDLVWALHPAVSAGRLYQLAETTTGGRRCWVPVGADLAVNLAGAPEVGVSASGGRLEGLIEQLGGVVDVEVDPDTTRLTLDNGVSVWVLDRSAPVTVTSTATGWLLDPWAFSSHEPPVRDGAVPAETDHSPLMPEVEELVGTGVVSLVAPSPPLDRPGLDGEGWWGAPVLDLVAAGQADGVEVVASGAVQAGIDAVLASCPVEVGVLGQDPSVTGVAGGLQPKPLAVLCFLAVGVGGGEEVFAQFWAGSENRSAMDNALTKLRRSLEPAGAGLVFDRDARSYRLESVGVDLHRLGRLVEMAESCLSVMDRLAVGAAALGLVRGPVLAGVGGPSWGWWHDDPDHYAHTDKVILDLADRVATGALALGDAGLAQRAARAGLLVVPGHERLGQLAMAAAHVGGDRDGVRAAYRLLERCLKAVDPDDALSTETEDLYRSLLGRETA